MAAAAAAAAPGPAAADAQTSSSSRPPHDQEEDDAAPNPPTTAYHSSVQAAASSSTAEQCEPTEPPNPVSPSSSTAPTAEGQSEQPSSQQPAMTLHFGLTSHGLSGRNRSNSQQQQQQEIRDTRKVLKQCVREDWDYPCLPAYQDVQSGRPNHNAATKASDVDDVVAVGETASGFRFRFRHPSTEDIAAGMADMYLKPREWREREISSESSTEEEDDDDGVGSTRRAQLLDQSQSQSDGQNERQTTGSWLFETPDSVGEEILDRRTAKKRKRQHALDEETIWNDGLALWMARRDAWCGAKPRDSVPSKHDSGRCSPVGANVTSSSLSASTGALSAATTSSTSMASSSSQRSSTSASLSTDANSTALSSAATTPDIDHLSTTSKTASSISTTTTTETNQPLHPTHPSSNILVPIVPRIFANHPIRRRITPSIYPEIYSKIIVQGRSPSVPINLQTLTSALVQGWQNDGEWPPKPGPVERAFAKKKPSKAETAAAAAAAANAATTAGGAAVGEKGAAAIASQHEKEKDGAIRNGVRAFQRVLRISHADSGVVADKR